MKFPHCGYGSGQRQNKIDFKKKLAYFSASKNWVLTNKSKCHVSQLEVHFSVYLILLGYFWTEALLELKD